MLFPTSAIENEAILYYIISVYIVSLAKKTKTKITNDARTLMRAEVPVAVVSEARDDVLLVIEASIHGRSDDLDTWIFRVNIGYSFRARYYVKEVYITFYCASIY